MLAKDLTYFSVIAQKGSLASAALSLGVSQPALTKCVHRLEKQLQVRLFERTPDGVSLTQIGRAFYERIQAVGVALEDAMRDVRDLRLGLSGDVRVGVTPSVPNRLIVAAHEAFARASPGSRTSITSAALPSLVPGLVAGELDFIVGPRPVRPLPGLSYEELYVDRVEVFASRDHPLAKADSYGPADFLNYPWVLPRGGDSYMRTWLESAYRARNLPTPQSSIEVELMEHAFALVSGTRLLAVGARRKIAEAQQCFPIRGFSVKPLPDEFGCGITARKRLQASPAVDKLKEAFRTAGARI